MSGSQRFQGVSDVRDDISSAVMCRNSSKKHFEYNNIFDCRTAYDNIGTNSYCEDGCIGLYSCVKACPNGAIRYDLSVCDSECRACGICQQVCPLKLIAKIPVEKKVFFRCMGASSTQDKSKICRDACHNCYLCMDICTRRAITINEKGRPQIELKKCNGCLKCVRKCPSGVISTTGLKIWD
ncbi:4Fe-4S binding protein [Elusimicrobiota bacterium]